jgi:hypothetical protein
LRHRRLGDEEGPRNLGRRQAAQRAKRQGDTSLRRQRRVAAGEDEAQALVGELVGFGVLGDDAAPELLERLERRPLRGQRPLAADAVDRLVASDLGYPRPRIARDPVPGPALQSDEERLLNRLLGEVEVSDGPDERRDRPPRLVPEQAVDDCRWTGGGLRRRAAGGRRYDAAFSRSSGWT